jgi:hypothetical protein
VNAHATEGSAGMNEDEARFAHPDDEFEIELSDAHAEIELQMFFAETDFLENFEPAFIACLKDLAKNGVQRHSVDIINFLTKKGLSLLQIEASEKDYDFYEFG